MASESKPTPQSVANKLLVPKYGLFANAPADEQREYERVAEIAIEAIDQYVDWLKSQKR